MNWVDFVIVAIVLASVAGGFGEGVTRMAIGSGALVFGFIAASWFHGIPAGWFQQYLNNEALASIFGFLTILCGSLILGGLLGWAVRRAFKLVGLSWLDRTAGGVFGGLRAILLLAVFALLITTFAPRRMPAAVAKSELGPHVLALSKVLSAVTPYTIKNRFERTYQEWRVIVEGVGNPSRPRRGLKYE
jgi:membrane protein required for colicin V production